MYIMNKAFQDHVKKYLLDNITLDDYKAFYTVNSAENKIRALYFIYGVECGQNYRTMEYWLNGLPSCLTLPFTYDDIEEVLAKWHKKYYSSEYDLDHDYCDRFTVEAFHTFIAQTIKNYVHNN